MNCSFCLRSFDSGYELNEHTNMKHGSETGLFVCEDCGRKFQDAMRLTEHMKRKHNKGEKLHIKHVGCPKNSDLKKIKCYNTSKACKRWGMDSKTSACWAHCVRCSGCEFIRNGKKIGIMQKVIQREG